MDIIFFHKSLIQYGGAEVVLFNDMASALENGQTVILCCKNISSELSCNLPKGIEYISYNNILELYNIFKRKKNTMIICSSGIIDIFLAKLSNVNNVVVYDHHPVIFADLYSWHSLPIIRRYAKRFSKEYAITNTMKFPVRLRGTIRNILHVSALRRAHSITVLSNFAAKEKKSLIGINAHIIYTGFPKPISKNISEKLKLTDYDLVVITRLSDDKNLINLIKAFYIFNKSQEQEYTLNIFGKGREKSTLDSVIEKLEIQRNVRLHGFITEQIKWEVLSETSVFINPQVADYNLTSLEAVFAGCKVVTSSIDVVCNEVSNGNMVFSGNLFDKDEFAKIIQKAVESNIKVEKFTMKNFRTPKLFTWKSRWAQIMERC